MEKLDFRNLRHNKLRDQCRVDEIQNAEVHVFCDSSQKAYGAISYLRAEKGDKVYVQHVMSKSKVAPIKGQTIPRLELMAAVLGCVVLKIFEDVGQILRSSCIGS